MIEYIFSIGQRVTDGRKCCEVTSTVQGNGRAESEWYFVQWDDGTSDRYMRDSLTPA